MNNDVVRLLKHDLYTRHRRCLRQHACFHIPFWMDYMYLISIFEDIRFFLIFTIYLDIFTSKQALKEIPRVSLYTSEIDIQSFTWSFICQVIYFLHFISHIMSI